MAGNILYLNISLVRSKCLFKSCLFDKGGMDDKIAMIAMHGEFSGKMFQLLTHSKAA